MLIPHFPSFKGATTKDKFKRKFLPDKKVCYFKNDKRIHN